MRACLKAQLAWQKGVAAHREHNLHLIAYINTATKKNKIDCTPPAVNYERNRNRKQKYMNLCLGLRGQPGPVRVCDTPHPPPPGF